MKSLLTVILMLSIVFASLGCSLSRTQKGAIIGTATGGTVGGVIGKKAGSTAVGAILGAAVGGAAGAYIGRYMDKQAAEIEKDIEGAEVQRVGEGIQITFDSGLLFDVNKAALKPETMANLDKLSESLKKYPDTDILVEGHTDSTGSEEHNLQLSNQRAQSVVNYLAGLGIAPTRFSIMGYGESQPVATNETEEGRQENRRVEVAIMANEKLKQAAEAEAG
jgi:outer membrane protein OmpA-like peptidoglycan-associated protein